MWLRFKRGLAAGLLRNWLPLLIIVVILICGVATGAVATRFLSVGQSGELGQYLETVIRNSGLEEVDHGLLVEYALWESAGIMAVVWFLGLTIIGAPLVLAVVFYRGFVLGFTVGFLIQEWSWGGLAVALTSIFPQGLLQVPALIGGATAALSFSMLLLRGHRNRQPTPFWRALFTYCGLMTFFLILAGLGGLVEGYLTPDLLNWVAGYLY